MLFFSPSLHFSALYLPNFSPSGWITRLLYETSKFLWRKAPLCDGRLTAFSILKRPYNHFPDIWYELNGVFYFRLVYLNTIALSCISVQNVLTINMYEKFEKFLKFTWSDHQKIYCFKFKKLQTYDDMMSDSAWSCWHDYICG